MEHDFSREKEFSYKNLTQQQVISHLAGFIADIWQVHPFGEGNTRTTAVLLIKYLYKLGYTNISNDPFAEHSWFFRNALVRANYEDIAHGIYADNQYLLRFLENLIAHSNNMLRNREMHIQSGGDTVNLRSDTVNDTVFGLIRANPHITAEEIRQKLDISIATVKRRIKRLKDDGKIRREGSDKSGSWRVVL